MGRLYYAHKESESERVMYNVETPYQAFECALADYATDRLAHDDLLQLVEGQYRLVQSWMKELASARESRFAVLRAHEARCRRAYLALSEGLKRAHAAITHRNRDALHQARSIMREGHEELSHATAA